MRKLYSKLLFLVALYCLGLQAAVAQVVWMRSDRVQHPWDNRAMFLQTTAAPAGYGAFLGSCPPGPSVDHVCQDRGAAVPVGPFTGCPNQTGCPHNPGSPQDNWAIEFNVGATECNFGNGYGGWYSCGTITSTATPTTITPPACVPGAEDEKRTSWTQTYTGCGGAGTSLRVTQTTMNRLGEKFTRYLVKVENTGSTTLTNVEFMRSLDPDQDISCNSTFMTRSNVLAQPPSATNLAVVDAVGANGLLNRHMYAARDPRARVSSTGFENCDPDQVFSGSGCPGSWTGCWATGSPYFDDDNGEDIAFRQPSLAPGECTYFYFLIILESTGVAATNIPCPSYIYDPPAIGTGSTGKGTKVQSGDLFITNIPATPAQVCPGETVEIDFKYCGYLDNGANDFIAELSNRDPTGPYDFPASPTIVGTTTITKPTTCVGDGCVTGRITVTVPAGVTDGSYRIRIAIRNADAPVAESAGCFPVLIVNPRVFDVSGGGTCCNIVGSSCNIPVCLSGSEVGVTYYLYRDGVDLGITRPGTGAPLCFPDQSINGIYEVYAVKDGFPTCRAKMNLSVTATIIEDTEPGRVINDQVICSAPIGTPAGLTLTGTPTIVGSVLRWESAFNSGFSGVITPISNTTTSYTPGLITTSVTTTYCYRALVRNGPAGVCPEKYSAPACILIVPLALTPSPILGKTEVCKDIDLGTIYQVDPALDPGANFKWSVSPFVPIRFGPGAGPGVASPSGYRAAVDWTVPIGTYTITVTPYKLAGTDSCFGPPRTLTVRVKTQVEAPVFDRAPTPFCPGEIGTYCVSLLATSEPATGGYIWSVRGGTPGGFTFIGPTTGSCVNIRWNDPGNPYQVEATAVGDCGPGPTSTTNVVVKQPPVTLSASPVSSTVCPNQTGLVYTASGAGPAPASTPADYYEWVVPPQAALVSGQGTPSITVDWTNSPVPRTTYSISVTAYYLGCQGPTETITVRVLDPPPLQPSPISGELQVCKASIRDYSVVDVLPSDPIVREYVWSGVPMGPPGVGAIIGGASSVTGIGGSTIRIDWNVVPVGRYNLTVVPRNECGSGPARSVVIEVIDIPSPPGAITPPPFHCVGSSRRYSVTPVPVAGLTYNWSVGPGCIITPPTSGVELLSVDIIPTSMTPCDIQVYSENRCGSSLTPSTFTIRPETVPNQPSLISGDIDVCQKDIERYSITGVSDETYEWTIEPLPPLSSTSGISFRSGQGTNVVEINWGTATPGQYNVVVTPFNRCGVGSPRVTVVPVTVTKKPDQPSVIGGPIALCEGLVGRYGVVRDANVDTYTWSVQPSTGVTLVQSGDSAIVTWSTPGNYILSVVPTNRCGDGPARTLAVRVAAKPVPNAGADVITCGPNYVVMGSPVGGTWSCVNCPPPATITSAGPYGIINGMTPQLHAFRYSINGGICGWQHDTVLVDNQLPIVGRVITNTTICEGETGTLNLVGYTPWAEVIRWERSTDNFLSSGIPIAHTGTSYTFTGLTETTQFRAVLRVPGGGCEPHSEHATVTVFRKEVSNPVPSTVTSCGPDALLNGNVPTQGRGEWSFVSGPSGTGPRITTSTGGVGVVSGMTLPGDYVFRYTIINPPCSDPSMSADVLVTRLEGITQANAGGNQKVCTETATLTGNMPAAGETGEWLFITGPVLANVTTVGNIGNVTGMTEKGKYIFRWKIKNPVCAGETYQDINVEKLEPPTTAVAGADQEICNASTTMLIGNVPSNGVGTWSFVSSTNGVVATVSTSGNIGRAFNMSSEGVYTFRYTITNGSCPPSSADVRVARINSGSAAQVLRSKYSVCDADFITLEAISPPVGSGSWSFVSGPTIANINTSGSSGIVDGMTAPGRYIFRWTVSNNCGTSTKDVEVVRDESIFPPATVAVSNMWVCDIPTALGEGSVIPSGATGLWRFISGPSVAQVRTFDRYGTITSMDAYGPYVFSWEVSKGNCPPSIAYLTVTRIKRPSIASAGTDQVICGDKTTFTGNLPSPGIGTWSFVSGPMTASVSQTGTVATVSAMTLPGDYYFRWTIESDPLGVCSPTSDDVRVSVSPPTNAGILGGNATVCSGSNAGTVSLSGYSGDIVRWEMSTDGFSSSGIPISNAGALLNYTNLTQTTSYRVVVKQGTCPEAVSNIVTITVNDASVKANAGLDQSICGRTATVTGNTPSGSGVGTWSLVSAPAGATPSISTSGTDGFISNMNVAGSYVFKWSIDYGSCGISSDNVVINVNPGLDAGSLSGNATVCSGSNSGSIVLSGSVGSIVRWERSTDGWQSKNDIINTNTVFNYSNLTETTSFRVVLSDPSCGTVTTNDVVVTVRGRAVVADAGSDLSICGSSAMLMGNDPSPATGVWSFRGGPVTPTLVSSGRMLNVSGLSLVGDYHFRWTIDNGLCGVSFDEVRVRVSSSSIAGNVLSNMTVCTGENSGTLRLTGYSGTIVRWEMSTDNWMSVTPISNVSEVQTFTNLTETTQYRAVVKSGSCAPETSIDATVTVVRPGVSANAGMPSTICEGDIAIVMGNRPTSGTGTWSLLSGSAGATVIQSGTIAYVGGLEAGKHIMRYTIDNSPCEKTFDDVEITVVRGVSPGTITGATTICGGSASGTLRLVGHTGSIIRWERSFDNFVTDITPISNTSATQVYMGLTRTTWYRVIVSSPDCGGTRSALPVKIEVVPRTEPANAGPNQIICSTTTTLVGNVPVSGTGTWSVALKPSGASPSVSTSGSMGTVTGMTESGTYVFRWTISNPPCASTSSDVTVMVTTPTVAGILTTSTPEVCSGSNGGTISLIGNNGSVVRWEYSTDGVTFMPLSITSTSYAFSDLTTTTWYRAVVKNGSCAEETTLPISIIVKDATASGSLLGDATVCAGVNSGDIVLSGHSGGVVRWESSTDGFGSSTVIPNSSPMYSFNNLSVTTQYRAVVNSSTCGEVYSNAVTITVLPGVTSGVVLSDRTVCAGSNSGVVNLSGHVGDVIRWEQSTSIGFDTGVTLLSNTSASQAYLNLTETTYFRALVGSSSCGTAYSSVVKITVDGISNGGIISGGSAACAGSNSGTLTLSGHIGDIVRWEYSSDGFSTITTVLNTTASESYLNLSSARCYRAIVKSGVCDEVSSSTKCVDISPVSVSGMPDVSVVTACAGSNSGSINLVGSVGEVIRWESSEDCSGFSNPTIIPNTSTSLLYDNLLRTTCFRAVVKSGVCPEVISVPSRVEVTPASVAGVVSGAVGACSGSASGTLLVSGHTGVVVRWETSRDGFATIHSSHSTSSTTFDYTGLTETTSYRVVVKNGICPEVSSAPVTVSVTPPSVGGVVSSSAPFICSGSSTTINLSGHTGSVVRWERSADCGFSSVTPIANTTTSLVTLPLMSSGCYRAVVKSGVCAEAFSSSVLVNVNPVINLTASAIVGCNSVGSITARATGGSGGFVYRIDPSVLPENTTGNFSNVGSGSYTITVRDGLGCEVSVGVLVGNTPTPTEIVSFSSITSSSALVEWAAVPPVTGVTYNLRYRVIGDANWTLLTGITTNTRVLTGLQNNTDYEVEVQYICPGGVVSGFSSSGLRNFKTLPMGTGSCVGATPPSIPVPVPGGVYVSGITSTSATVNWNLVDGAAGYIVSYGFASAVPTSWTQVVVCHPTSSYTMTGLTPGIAYRVRVRTNCSNCTTALQDTDLRSNWSAQFGFTPLFIRGTEEVASQIHSLTVYPNPNEGNFIVRFSNVSEELVSVELFDLAGKSVYRSSVLPVIGNNELGIDLKDVSAGVYLLEFKQGNIRQSVKVVVQ